ncbi:OprO/OprP family phosphate-selective porin (plasmid) [Methylosinus sp. 3S-1]
MRKLEAEIVKLRKEARDAKVAASTKTTNVANAATVQAIGATDPKLTPPPPPVFVSFKNGLFVETEDKAYSVKFGGRVLVDGGGAIQPETGLNSNVNFRQVWLQVEGRAARYWDYKLAYEFANTSAVGTLGGLRDAYLAFHHPALTVPVVNTPLTVMIGNQWGPNGLETINTFLYTDFMERSLVSDTFGAGRHLGASFSTYGSDWSVKGGVFSTSPQDKALAPAASNPVPDWVNSKAGWVATGGAQYFEVAGRATYAPVKDADKLIHLGLSGRYHQPNSSTGGNDDRNLLLGASTNMESNILRTNLLGTPDLSCGAVVVSAHPAVAGNCVRDAFFYGAEFVGSYGPLSIQAEYMGAHYDRRGSNILLANLAGNYAPGGTSQNFDGYYVYGTWYLTGESRAASYSVTNPNNPATFGQIKILKPLSAGGWGAWELGARFSSVNLNDGPYSGTTFQNLLASAPNAATRAYIANSSVVGGSEQDVTVGVNWYPDDGIRFMANWTHVTSLTAPWNRAYLNGAHPDTFLLRTQVYW